MTGDLLKRLNNQGLNEDDRGGAGALLSRLEGHAATADAKCRTERQDDTFPYTFNQLGEVLFDSLPKEVRQEALAKGSDVDRARLLCESPIEEDLLPWLVNQDYGQITSFPIPIHNPKEDHLPPAGPIFLVPQFVFAKFRMDFALIARSSTGIKIVDVECDGKAFHYEVMDTARDAYLLRFGIPTVRITSKEIRDNPKKAAQRAARAISDLVG